ncbi:hypothetical protein PRZ48_014710 [Zasmidium cellare]|uniref:Helicase ATP-binding domain-containing protein n=1 Tax=Zasmidium cellare TaxID=395010 RepID=A0ABR0DZ16_ZASCE|nr:hypothetical protein PRZ48_014710 [Zasmidium cellare]
MHTPISLADELAKDQNRLKRSHDQLIQNEYDGFDVIKDKQGSTREEVGKRSGDEKGCQGSGYEHATGRLNRKAGSNLDRENGEDNFEADGKVSRDDVEAALFGATGHPGPELDLCLELLGMKQTKRHGSMFKYRSEEYMNDCKIDLLPTQITGMVHMLLRTLGTFPLSKAQEKDRARFEAIIQKLKYDLPLTHGGILGDSPGMGKTYTTLAFINWYAQHAKHVDENGNPDHRPSLLVAPDGVVFHQWVTAAAKMFPKLRVVVCKPGDPWPRMKGDHRPFTYLNSTQTKNPKHPDSGFPDSLQYMFDKTDPRASQVLLMAPYRTWQHRVVDYTPAVDEIQKQRDLKDPPPLDPNCQIVKLTNADDKVKFGRDSIVKIFTCPFWQKDEIGMAICDEGHTIRNPTTHTHWSVRGLKAKKNWLLTATSEIQHTPVLWPSILEELKQHPKWDEIAPIVESLVQPWTKINKLQLMRLAPGVLRALLESRDLTAIAENFKHFDNVLTLPHHSRFKLGLANSHDEWREAAQANKALIDSATKALSGDTKKILAKSLKKEGVKEIEDVENTILGKVIRGIRDRALFGDEHAEDRQSLYRGVLQKDVEERMLAEMVPEQEVFSKGPPSPIDPEAAQAETFPLPSSSAPTRVSQEEMARHVAQALQKKEDLGEQRDHDTGNEDAAADGDEDEDTVNTEALRVAQHGSIYAQDLLNVLNTVRSLQSSIKTLNAGLNVEFDKYIPKRAAIGDRWKRFTLTMTNSEKAKLGQDIIYTLHICQMIDHDQQYTPDNIKKLGKLTLERGLRLLHKHRFGQQRTKLRIIPLLDSTALETDGTGLAIMAKIKLETSLEDISRTASLFGSDEVAK